MWPKAAHQTIQELFAVVERTRHDLGMRPIFGWYPKRYPDAQGVLYDYDTFEKAGLLPAGAGNSHAAPCVDGPLDALRTPVAAMETPRPVMPEPDIPPIFMDLDAGLSWGAQVGEMIVEGYSKADLDKIDRTASTFVTPIMVRRSILSALGRDALQTGIAFLIVLIQFTLAIDMDPDRVSAREVIVALIVALVVSVALLVARLRQQV